MVFSQWLEHFCRSRVTEKYNKKLYDEAWNINNSMRNLKKIEKYDTSDKYNN